MIQLKNHTANTAEEIEAFVNSTVLNKPAYKLVNITTVTPVGRSERFIVWYTFDSRPAGQM